MKVRVWFSTAFLATLFCQAIAQHRIVTAGSSTTEIVCALGLGDKIIATDRTSLYPQKMQLLPSIGYRDNIGAEGIISLQPDLIILEKEYVKEDVVSQLKSTGIKILVVEHAQNFESTKTRIRAIASVLSKTKEGEALITKTESALQNIQKKVNASTIRPTVLCVYARSAGAMQVAGKNTSFGILPLAGLQNVLSDIEGYKPLNTESLIQANPDYILFFTTGLESIGGIEGALKIAGVEQTTAGKKKQIIHMDGILLTNWGPRVAEAAEQLFLLTHSEAKP
jgi:iron complex transport system substrate-binding protein